MARRLAVRRLAVRLLALAADPQMHALPWYFGAAVFAVWAVATVVVVLLARRRLKARAERRRDERDGRPRPRTPRYTGPIRDDRSVGPGTDLDRW